jgi:hypothetical protein
MVSSSIPLASTCGGDNRSISPSPHAKPGQIFSPMAELYDVSQANNGTPQDLHHSIPVAIPTPSSCSIGVPSVGALSQKPSISAKSRQEGYIHFSPDYMPCQRLPQQQISWLPHSGEDSQVRTLSPGFIPGPE